MTVYEPVLTEDLFYNSEVVRDFTDFTDRADLIVANRLHPELAGRHGQGLHPRLVRPGLGGRLDGVAERQRSPGIEHPSRAAPRGIAWGCRRGNVVTRAAPRMIPGRP